jgi:hypothetical protein
MPHIPKQPQPQPSSHEETKKPGILKIGPEILSLHNWEMPVTKVIESMTGKRVKASKLGQLEVER